MFKSPLVLPVTLILAGALAFMATTGVLPPDVMRLWPIIFVILGLVGLISLSAEELGLEDEAPARPMAKKAKKEEKKAESKPVAKATKKAAAKKKTTKRTR